MKNNQKYIINNNQNNKEVKIYKTGLNFKNNWIQVFYLKSTTFKLLA